jgi:proteic killer suppression protein
VEVSFRKRQLQRAFEESEQAIRLWGKSVARKYVMRIVTLQSACDFTDVQRLAALMRAHPLRGRRAGQWALDLTARYRLIVRLSSDSEEVMIEGGTSHYGD